MNTILFYIRSVQVVTFSKDFKNFEKTFLRSEFNFVAHSYLTEREKLFVEIIYRCYVFY